MAAVNHTILALARQGVGEIKTEALDDDWYLNNRGGRVNPKNKKICTLDFRSSTLAIFPRSLICVPIISITAVSLLSVELAGRVSSCEDGMVPINPVASAFSVLIPAITRTHAPRSRTFQFTSASTPRSPYMCPSLRSKHFFLFLFLLLWRDFLQSRKHLKKWWWRSPVPVQPRHPSSSPELCYVITIVPVRGSKSRGIY